MIRKNINKLIKGTAAAMIMGLLIVTVPTQSFAAPSDDFAEGNVKPSSYNVDMSERFISDYGLYEECIADQFYFYSNVSNGAFTSETVTFEIPSNISCIFEKDGAGYNYNGKISQKGNYVVRVIAVSGETTYNSTFRFSIRDKSEAPASSGTQGTQQEISLGTIGADSGSSLISSQGRESADIVDDDPMTITESDLLNIDENEEISDEQINQMIENAGISFDEEGMFAEPTDEGMMYGFEADFNKDKGMYSFKLNSGELIYANVPMGAIVNGSVYMEFPEQITPVVYRNGVEEFYADYTFSEDGFYQVMLNGSSLDYAMTYSTEDTAAPFVTFRIVKHPVNDIEIFNAPRNAKIVSAGTSSLIYLNEEGTEELDLDFFELKEDDTYYFKIYDTTSSGSYEVVIQKDTQAPIVNVVVEKGRANISFGSNDIAGILAYRNGAELSEVQSVIKNKGNYTIMAKDQAGNISSVDFVVKTYLNAQSIATLIILVLGGFAAFVFLKLQRNKMRVR